MITDTVFQQHEADTTDTAAEYIESYRQLPST